MDGRHDFIAVDTEFRRFVRETYHRGRRVSDAAMLRRYDEVGALEVPRVLVGVVERGGALQAGRGEAK